MLTEVHLYLAMGVPTFVILASLTVNLVQVFRLRKDVRELRNEFEMITRELAVKR
jgi:hypothetical protein